MIDSPGGSGPNRSAAGPWIGAERHPGGKGGLTGAGGVPRGDRSAEGKLTSAVVLDRVIKVALG
jgi:hypothetical protein